MSALGHKLSKEGGQVSMLHKGGTEREQAAGEVLDFVLLCGDDPTNCSFKSCFQNYTQVGGRHPRRGTKASLLRGYGDVVFPSNPEGCRSWNHGTQSSNACQGRQKLVTFQSWGVQGGVC